MKRDITGVLLAAGQSRRFSGNKLLEPLPGGVPVAVASARRLCAVLPESIAVVDRADSEVAELLRHEGLQITVNERAEEGMGSSIAQGVASSRNARGWVITLADMPCIPSAVVQHLVDGLCQGADCIAPVFRGRRGHPVGFSARHAEALMGLSGDEGARSVLDANRDQLELIETDDAGVVIDIDTPGDMPDAQVLSRAGKG